MMARRRGAVFPVALDIGSGSKSGNAAMVGLELCRKQRNCLHPHGAQIGLHSRKLARTVRQPKAREGHSNPSTRASGGEQCIEITPIAKNGVDVMTSHPASEQAAKRSFIRVVGKQDRKSTRLNSSHQIISYAVFCLKKKRTRQ